MVRKVLKDNVVFMAISKDKEIIRFSLNIHRRRPESKLLAYVDGIIVVRDDLTERQLLEERLVAEFEMKDLGKLTYFQRIEVHSKPRRFLKEICS